MKAIELESQLRHKQKSIEDLVGYLNNTSGNGSNYSLLMGAGSSATSGISTGNDLIKSWRVEAYLQCNPNGSTDDSADTMQGWLGLNEASWYSLDTEYSSLFERKFSMRKQRRDFIESQISGRLPSIGYPYLVRLAEKKYINTFFTTNFDDLLNEAFYQFSSERPLVCAHDSSIAGISVASHRSKIIKLHGDYLYDNLKSTVQDTNRLTKDMDEKLREFSKVLGLIVVGYSGGDRSIMRILHDLIDDSSYLQNGLYWCLRKSDFVNSEVMNCLRKDGCFFVLVDGFDELMAELYVGVCGKGLPFSARPGSDFAAKIIQSYANSPSLENSQNKIIKNHLKSLKDEQNSSLVADALQSLHKDRGDDAQLRDADFIKYIELERLFRCRDYKLAFNQVSKYVNLCDDIIFKRILLDRMYFASKRLYQYDQAKNAISLLREIEPENSYLPVALCDVTDSQTDKLRIMRDAIEFAPFSESIHTRYAMELEAAYHGLNVSERPDSNTVAAAYKKSIDLSPHIRNLAWRKLFDFLSNAFVQVDNKDDLRKWIVDEHLTQNAFDHRSLSLLIDWCKDKKVDQYDSKPVVAYVLDAFKKHYPRRYSEHLRIIKDLCVEFNQYAALKEAIDTCERAPGIHRDVSYVGIKMDLLVEVFRDPEEAIRLGEDFTERRPATAIETRLFYLYLGEDLAGKASTQLDRLAGALDLDDLLELKIKLLEHQGKYQDAVDILDSIALRKGKDRSYAMSVSFTRLLMKDYKGAFDAAKEFLDAHGFNLRYQEIVINYEFARLKLGKSISKARLASLETSNSENVKAVAMLLLDKKKEALALLKHKSESDYSKLISYLKWPVLEGLALELCNWKTELLKKRRTFPSENSKEIIEVEMEVTP